MKESILTACLTKKLFEAVSLSQVSEASVDASVFSEKGVESVRKITRSLHKLSQTAYEEMPEQGRLFKSGSKESRPGSACSALSKSADEAAILAANFSIIPERTIRKDNLSSLE